MLSLNCFALMHGVGLNCALIGLLTLQSLEGTVLLEFRFMKLSMQC